MMLRLWRWTYARMYLRCDRTWGRAQQPALTAAGVTALVILANVFSAAWAASLLLGADPDLRGHKPYTAAATLILLFLVYRAYVVKGGASQLIRTLKRQTRAQTSREERSMWLYIVGSLLVPMLVGLLAMHFRS